MTTWNQCIPTIECEDSTVETINYAAANNTTDFTWSYNTDTLKFNWNLPFSSPDGQPFHDFIVACVEAGNEVEINMTDFDGNEGVFVADGVIENGTNQSAFTGAGDVSLTQSAKLFESSALCRSAATITALPVKIVCDTPPDDISVDTELVCNVDTGFWEYHTIISTNGAPAAPTVAVTAIPCTDPQPDYEQVRVCDQTTQTVHIVTSSIIDGVVAELLRVDTLQDCPKPSSLDCVESQSWAYGIDNTGTSYDWTSATYEMTLSDGSVLTWEQTTASNAGWTAQLTEWAANIQAAADAAGLNWTVEPRFVDNSNPDNIDGTSNGPGGAPSGLPGVPSQTVSNYMIDNGIGWRFVFIEICPGQPVPVGAAVTSHSDSVRYGGAYDNGGRVGYNLVSTSALLSPINKFFVCRECGETPIWYLDDGVTLAEPGQIPNCWEPCGTLSQLPAPPEKECTFFVETFCDNNNETDPSLFTPSVTRKTTYCSGQPTLIEYFIPDPADPAAFLDYTLVGDFVDCTTGQVVGDPEPECSATTFVGNLYQINETEVGTNIDWWAPTAFPAGSNAAPHGNVSDIFTVVGGTLEHINGAPDVSYISATFDTSGTSSAAFQSNVGAGSNAETSGTDQLKLSGYIVLQEPAVLRDTNGNTGERGGIAINVCCAGDLEWAYERTTDTLGGDVGVFDGVRLPAGIHYVEAVTSDLSAWQGLQMSASFDDGATFTPFTSYLTKPSYTCVPVIRCETTGVLLNATDNSLITVGEFDLWCEPKGCGSSSSSTPNGAVDEALTTGFHSELFNSGFTVPVAPLGTKEMVVFNDSGAWIQLETSIGTQIVPPGGSASWAVDDTEPDLTVSSVTILSGTFGPNDNWAVNYRTRL